MGTLDYVRAASKKRILDGEIPHWIAKRPKHTAAYILQAVLSAPPWVNRKDLRTIQQFARFMTATTGTLHTVDHIMPLRHPLVCGLTVPWNLRVIPAKFNYAKGNDWCPDQLELDLAPVGFEHPVCEFGWEAIKAAAARDVVEKSGAAEA